LAASVISITSTNELFGMSGTVFQSQNSLGIIAVDFETESLFAKSYPSFQRI